MEKEHATNVSSDKTLPGQMQKPPKAKKRQQARHKISTAKGEPEAQSSRRTSGAADIAAVIARLPKKVLAYCCGCTDRADHCDRICGERMRCQS